ncbi:MAG TPA: hypothetical protein VN238_12955, partial [Solirubrobacteraceae bacterium]|nr:hypothetical protein [Solirubrobacteraceae bacterium]
MPRRSVRLLGALLLLLPCVAATPALAAPTWQAFDAPLAPPGAIGPRDADLAPDGRAVVAFQEGSALRIGERRGGEMAFASRTLLSASPTSVAVAAG